MKHVKQVFVLFVLLSFTFAFSLVACSPNSTTTQEKATNSEKSQSNSEKTFVEGGTNNDGGQEAIPESSAKEATPQPIEFTFEPKDGEIDVKDVCITVKMSFPPAKLLSAEFLEEGKTIPTSANFSYDLKKDKTKKTAKVCPYSFLTQGAKYTLTVKVKGRDKKEYTGTATYTTKKTFAKDKPADPGMAVDLQITAITTPALLGSLLEGEKDKIPPILLTLHERDKGNSGKLVLVGGVGRAPAGGKAHQGKDVVDTKQPISLALIGRFDGRWFAVGPTTFVLSVAGYALKLQNFHLTGIFSKDGKNIEDARLTAVVDPDDFKDKIDLCTLITCQVGPDGKKFVRIAGNLKGIVNPIPYSVFITKPIYLENNVDPATNLEIYTNGETKKDDMSFKIYKCEGSQKENKPCSVNDGATISEVKKTGTLTMDTSKKKGTYKLPSLDAKTWYKVTLEAKSEKGETFKTFTLFQTK